MRAPRESGIPLRVVPLRYAAALVASVLFGLAIVPDWGTYSDAAVTWVILGVLVVGALFWTTRQEESPPLPLRITAPAVWAGVLVLAAYAAWAPDPLLYPVGSWALGRAAQWGVFATIWSYGPTLVRPEARWGRHLRFAVLAALVAFMGVQTIRTSPAPQIDVWTVQQEGAAVFLSGKNPFQDVRLADTGPRTATDVPYVYPPLQLYVSTAAWALFGDVRYASLLALILLGLATRALAVKTSGGTLPALLEDAPALFIWCTPKLAFILEQAWIDPIQLFWCSALLLAWRRPWAVAVLAGFVLGAKQTMALVVLPVGLALGFTLRQWLLAGAVALLPMLPWLLWDFRAWKHANFDFLNALPLREDALTVVTWARQRLHLRIPWVVGFIAAALIVARAGWRGRQGIGRATITALTAMTLFFTFNKWAFANYYFTLLGLAALAAAASLTPREPLSEAAPPP